MYQNNILTFVWHVKWFLPFHIIHRKSELNIDCSIPLAVVRLAIDILTLLSLNVLQISQALPVVLLIKLFCHIDIH